MKLTILGKSPAWEDAAGACSGYLVCDRDTVALIDCGNGVFAKLRQHLGDYGRVQAVVVSHFHADHVLDLVPYAYALGLAPGSQPAPWGTLPAGKARPRPGLYAPTGSVEKFRRMAGCWGDETLIEGAFALEEVDAGDTVRVGSLSFGFAEVPHYTLTHAIDVRSDDGARFTFGADCAPSDSLTKLAAETPLLIAEATLPTAAHDRSGDPPGHMAPDQAGSLAKRARAQRLLLTHLSDELDPEWMLGRAAANFGGQVDLAREGLEIDL